MEVVSERVRRRAVLALAVAVLLAAPGVANAADVTDVVPDTDQDTAPDAAPDTDPGAAPDTAPDTDPDGAPDNDATEQPPPDEEPPPDEQPPPADKTALLLQPICTADGLQRFSVTHITGPATEFTVRAAGTTDGQTLSIGVGQTRHFWVEAAPATEIEWADGSASATPASEACSSQVADADAPPPAPPSAPSGSAESVPSEGSSALPASSATPEPDATAAPLGGNGSEPPVAPPDAPAVAAQDSAEPQGEQAAPRPRPNGPGGAYVCPEGWVPVDANGDGRIEPSDECEVLVATGADGALVRAPFATVALLVTIGLLVTSVAVGALGRGRVALLPRIGLGRAPSRAPRPRPPAR